MFERRRVRTSLPSTWCLCAAFAPSSRAALLLVVRGERGGTPARALAASGMQASSGLRTVASPQFLSASVSPTAPRWCGARGRRGSLQRAETRPENPPRRAARTSARCGLSIGQVGNRAFSDVSGMSRIAPVGHCDIQQHRTVARPTEAARRGRRWRACLSLFRLEATVALSAPSCPLGPRRRRLDRRSAPAPMLDAAPLSGWSDSGSPRPPYARPP